MNHGSTTRHLKAFIFGHTLIVDHSVIVDKFEHPPDSEEISLNRGRFPSTNSVSVLSVDIKMYNSNVD